MKPPPKDKFIKRPFQYTSAADTNVAITIRRARAVIEATRQHASNVQPLRKKVAA